MSEAMGQDGIGEVSTRAKGAQGRGGATYSVTESSAPRGVSPSSKSGAIAGP